MAINQVRYTPVRSDSILTNTGYINTDNPFVKQSPTNTQTNKPAQTQTANTQAGKYYALWGTNLVKEKEIKPNTTTNPQTTNPTLLQLLKFASNKADNYNTAIDNALKYIPPSGELSIIIDANKERISEILKQQNLSVKMNYDNLKTIKHTHLATTIEFSQAIGQELGLTQKEIETMGIGAALHDIGKVLIPESILNKNGKLDTKEREIINLHSTLGYEILKAMKFKNDIDPRQVAEIARDHHNPNSQNKLAQIVRAADVYSAMREERPYKAAKSHEEAMAVLNDMGIKKEILSALDKKYGQPKVTPVAVQYQPHFALAH